MTPGGAVLAGMANATRRGEVPYVRRALASEGIPVLHQVSGGGSFEGADALWVDHGLVVVGVGHRTNPEGYAQVRDALADIQVECIGLPSTQTVTQHLLGAVQIVDKDLALVRYEIADPEVVEFLERRHFTLIRVPESEEVLSRQAMNIVTVAPRSIIMSRGCPETRELFQRAGLTIAAELELTQLISGAGGLACATGIIAREE
jgi:N-dimethylarginine dimethylaminohydrolase